MLHQGREHNEEGHVKKLKEVRKTNTASESCLLGLSGWTGYDVLFILKKKKMITENFSIRKSHYDGVKSNKFTWLTCGIGENNDLLEEGMATHSSTPAWRIPWTQQTGSLQSVGSQRAGHSWTNSLCTNVYFLCLPGNIAFALWHYSI